MDRIAPAPAGWNMVVGFSPPVACDLCNGPTLLQRSATGLFVACRNFPPCRGRGIGHRGLTYAAAAVQVPPASPAPVARECLEIILSFW